MEVGALELDPYSKLQRVKETTENMAKTIASLLLN